MTVDAMQGLADRIGDLLGPIHRGAIRIGDTQLAIFGNDGYSADGVPEIAAKVSHWLAWKGWSPSPVSVCADGYTWVITATPKGDIGRARELADRCVWKTWKATPNSGRTPQHAGGFQRELAHREIAAFGGGFTAGDLSTPLAGKGGRVRGDRLANSLMLAKVAGGEDAFVVLGGIPFPVKMLGAETGGSEEVAVLTEDVGDPRSDGEGTATAFLPAGHAIIVRHFGEMHETTGRRLLVPINWTTGELAPD